MLTEQFGYPILGVLILGECAGLPIPGETALIAAGGLAARGQMSLAIVIGVASVAATGGDTVGYWLGRRRGRRFFMRDGRFARRRRAALKLAERFFARYGAGAVFVGRWVSGLRYLAALLAGATQMSYRRFAVANALGAMGWASSVAVLSATIGAQGPIMLAAAAVTWAMALAVVGILIRHRLG